MKNADVSLFLLWCWRTRVQRNLFMHCYAVPVTRGHPYSGWILYIIRRSHLAKTWRSSLNTVARTRIKWLFRRILMKGGCLSRKYVNLYSTTRTKLRPGRRMSGVWFQADARAFNITLNSVRQHNYFITRGNYISYMFRLQIRHLQAYFCHLSHKMLCTLWDPIVFTSMEYIKLNHLSQRVWTCKLCLQQWDT